MRNAVKMGFYGLILVNMSLLSGCAFSNQAVVKPKLEARQGVQNLAKFTHETITSSGTGLGEAKELFKQAYGSPTSFTGDGKILKYQPENKGFFYTAFFVHGLAAQVSVNYNQAVSPQQAVQLAQQLIPKDAVQIRKDKKFNEDIQVYKSGSLIPRFEGVSRDHFINNIAKIEPGTGAFSVSYDYNDKQLVDSIVIEVGEEG
jgi:hypothetical protein